MKLSYLLLSIHVIVAKKLQTWTPKRIICDGVVFNDMYYERVLLLRNMGRPSNLLMHKFSSSLFFSHTILKNNLIDFEIKMCHLKKKRCESVSGLPGGYAIGYDAGNDDLYFGGHDGIYKYNFITKVADFFSEDGKSVWGIFIGKNFYYIRYPTQKLYVYTVGSSSFKHVAEAGDIEIDNFYISKAGDIYFSNKTAVFKIEKPLKKDTIVINDEILVRQIVEDGYGDVYFCANTGIYIDEKPFNRLKKIFSGANVFGLTFDEDDNLIYSDKHSIYKLVQSEFAKYCYKYLADEERPWHFAMI